VRRRRCFVSFVLFRFVLFVLFCFLLSRSVRPMQEEDHFAKTARLRGQTFVKQTCEETLKTRRFCVGTVRGAHRGAQAAGAGNVFSLAVSIQTQ
jgi:hypothetical protein